MLRFIISAVLVGLSSSLFAQSVVFKKDSVKGKFLPTSIRVGTDLISLTKTFLKEDFEQYAFTADVDFNRYYFNVEYGSLRRRSVSSFNNLNTYEVSGSYFRFGPDVNFLKKDPEKNALFFGARYARSSFSDELSYSPGMIFNNEQNILLANNKLSASWLEMLVGLKVRLTDILWLGYTARFKLGVSNFEDLTLIPNEIPGYGRADKNSYWGFNYWIIVRIPFKKTKQSVLNIDG